VCSSDLNKVNDTDRAPVIFCICDEEDVTKRWDSTALEPFVAYSVAHCFLLFFIRDGSTKWSIEKLRQTPVLTKHPPQQGLVIVNIDGVVELKFAKDGVHSVEAIPIVREALLKAYTPRPPPPSHGKDQTIQNEDGKTSTTMTRRPYILVVVITLVILLGLIGGMVYMAS
jgi:hypothetical protein